MADTNLLSNYRPSDYRTLATNLYFELATTRTKVVSTLSVRRVSEDTNVPLVLYGRDLKLVRLVIDGTLIASDQYELDSETLKIWGLPSEFSLLIETHIYPDVNTALEGLYKSKNMFCTQCEAEGFRKITYYQDRPDVLSVFTTTIVADKDDFPTLLSNGNLTEQKFLPDGRHSVTWFDPFPKPSYLFALVAGNLSYLKDKFLTKSGREVELYIYSEPHNIDKCHYAMGALKRAMRWDEEAFGREYDLDIFMIVAVEDFNMGAMENKGLNIFNTSCVLATPNSATDDSFRKVESIIAHEYFHNWSGNRVTCRDWFQLSLKEGFTVFRDSQFTGDINSHGIKRIEDVSLLRAVQFPEDAGPLAHPVQPASYIEISNFYTATVYEKGSELVRMLWTILGARNFRKATDKYFDRFDGKAATVEDFFEVMQDFIDHDISQFYLWYKQAGTPVLSWNSYWEDNIFTLDIRQSCPPTVNQELKYPMYIPLRLGLLDAEANELVDSELCYECSAKTTLSGDSSMLIHLNEHRTTLQVDGLSAEPKVSFLRDFSAPVRVNSPISEADLSFLVMHDSDVFVRWDSMQNLLVSQLDRMQRDETPKQLITELFGELLDQVLGGIKSAGFTPSLAELCALLRLPEASYIFDQVTDFDVDAVCRSRQILRHHIGESHIEKWREIYSLAVPRHAYDPGIDDASRRSFRNLCLYYEAAVLEEEKLEAFLMRHYLEADNLTDRSAVLFEVAHNSGVSEQERMRFLDSFYDQWQGESLVIDNWFSAQASSSLYGVSEINKLAEHIAFDDRNPNKVRALYGAFFQRNHQRFHSVDGSGYQYLADIVVKMDRLNPSIAARLAAPLARWQRHDGVRSNLMCDALKEIASVEKLSKDVSEIVTKSLQPLTGKLS